VKAVGKIPNYRGIKLKRTEFVDGEACLIYDRQKSFFRNIFTRVIRDNSSASGLRIVPDFMTPFCVSVKEEARFAEFMDYFIRAKGGNFTQISTGREICVFILDCLRSKEDISEGRGSPCSIQDSMSFRATSSAISSVSDIVLPCAISPCRAELVARYSPSSRCSMVTGIKYSDIVLPPVGSIARLENFSNVKLGQNKGGFAYA